MSETPDFDLFGYDPDEPRPSADAALAALLEAGPEAAEHLLKAAHELLLAAKAVVDAGERALEAHRAASGAGAATPSGEAAPEESPREPARRVRRIDLA
jgi:hypothetical protein